MKRVAVFTGTRAEYGLLVPVLRALEQSETIEMSLIAGGTHLSMLHGMTIDAIEADGFVVDARVEMLLAADTPSAITKSIGVALIDLAVRFEQLQPDLLVLLGDRYEVLAAALAAVVANIPIAHIHGGEITVGAFDDSIRHAVTKLAHLHFVATEEFARRVEQLGEDPRHIHVVGAPTVDVISRLGSVPTEELEADLGIELRHPLVILAYHPSTVPGEDPIEATETLLRAMEQLSPATLVCSLPNADPHYGSIATRVRDFAGRHPWAVAIDSIGHERYLSLLRQADLIVGNSSSGIIEAPVVGTASVTVGQRQEGRPLAGSTVAVPLDVNAIVESCRLAVDSCEQQGDRHPSPYDRGMSVGATIVEVIETLDLGSLIPKRFVDHL